MNIKTMSKYRQLAAIMFTDIVGYTAIMGKDETKAMGLVHRSREVQKRLVNEFEGRWLKEMGDGVLCSFPSASDAIYCALEIQEQLFQHADLQLRIGIHLGEVLIENGDIFSDSVNIASRLQAIAEPGGIYLSEPVQKAIRGQTDIQTVYLGELQLKNVDYEIKTYALRGEGLPPIINGSAKRLSGRVWAEINQRSLNRVGIVYLSFACILLGSIPLVPILELYRYQIMGILILGFVVAMVAAWKYERSPNGFVRILSGASWVNPYTDFQKKPFTSNSAILILLVIVLGINGFSVVEKRNQLKSPTIPDRSIAVIPFCNMSNDPELQQFIDGIQEDILTQLSKNPVLNVKSRTSTLRYQKAEETNIEEIGSALGVGHVLEGSVRKEGNWVRVNAQLIEVETDTQIWSGAYDRELTNGLTIQQQLALSISHIVIKRLTDA